MLNDIALACQALRSSAYDEALAEHLGLNATDLRCLELAIAQPGSTPSRLADLSGLTTGAITGVVDRLEKAGFVTRRPDPMDRRSVTVQPVAAGVARLTEARSGLETGVAAAMASLATDERLAIDRFLEGAEALVAAETARLRAGSRGGFIGDTFTAPLGPVTRGRLAFASGAPRMAFNLSPLGPQATARVIMETSASRLEFAGATPHGELIVASFGGPRPDVRVSGGLVTVRYPRKAAAAFTTRSTRIALNPTIPWTVEIAGGITDLTGTLDAVSLERVDVQGGANHVRLDLPEPHGTVPVRLAGTASSARFQRPRGVPVAVRVAGGVSHLRIDSKKFEQVGGKRVYQTAGYADSPDRFELDVLGGASEVVVGSR